MDQRVSKSFDFTIFFAEEKKIMFSIIFVQDQNLAIDQKREVSIIFILAKRNQSVIFM